MRKKMIAILLVSALVFLATGCNLKMTDLTVATEKTIATTARITEQTTATTSQPVKESAALATINKETAVLSKPPVSFEKLAEELLLAGLMLRDRQINLDQLCYAYELGPEDISDLSDRLYLIFDRLYRENPWYFYLDGSYNLNYQIEDERQVTSLALEPGYRAGTEYLSDQELTDLISQLHAAVDAAAARIKRQTANPQIQLILAHDFLVSTVAYDPTLDQGINHAASALLDGITLCQGYAQAFQMIGQALGFEVLVITGMVEDTGHAWNLVELDHKFYHVDVTHDDPLPDGGPQGEISHVHLFRSDQVMRQTHDWDSELYPACTEDGAFYYRQSDRIARNMDSLAGQILSAVRQAGNFSELQIEMLVEDFKPTQHEVEEVVLEILSYEGDGRHFFYLVNTHKDILTVKIST